MNIVKLAVFAGCLSAGSVAFAQQNRSELPQLQVYVQSEAKDLARGYAKAFSTLSRFPITVAVKKEGESVRFIEDIKSVRDSEGALIIESGRGLVVYIVNARDVVYITDGPVLK